MQSDVRLLFTDYSQHRVLYNNVINSTHKSVYIKRQRIRQNDNKPAG